MKKNDYQTMKANVLALRKKAQSFKKTAKAKMAKMLKVNFSTLETTDGQVLYIDGDEIAVGLPVYLLGEDGQYVEAPDQTVVVDGVTYVIEGGVIASINEPAGEGEAEGTAMADEAEGAESIETPAEVSGEVDPATVNALIESVDELIDVVTDQEQIINDQAEEIEAINAELHRAKRTTNGKPANVAKFNRMKKLSTIDERFERLKKNFRK